MLKYRQEFSFQALKLKRIGTPIVKTSQILAALCIVLLEAAGWGCARSQSTGSDASAGGAASGGEAGGSDGGGAGNVATTTGGSTQGGTGGAQDSTGGVGGVMIPDPVSTFSGQINVLISPEGLGTPGGARIEGQGYTGKSVAVGTLLVVGYINDNPHFVDVHIDPRSVNGAVTQPSGELQFYFPGDFIVSWEVLEASRFDLHTHAAPQQSAVSLANLDVLLDGATLLGSLEGSNLVSIFF